MSYEDASFECWLQIHAMPVAQLAAVELGLSKLLSRSVSLDWSLFSQLDHAGVPIGLTQGQQLYAASVTLPTSQAQFEDLVAFLSEFEGIYFEISHPLSSSGLGERICYTPALGLYRSSLDQFGNQVFNENQLTRILRFGSVQGGIEGELRAALGFEWDAQLEPLRSAKVFALERRSLAS